MTSLDNDNFRHSKQNKDCDYAKWFAKPIALKFPIIKMVERGDYIFITLSNNHQYRVSPEGKFVRSDLRIV